MLTADKKVGPLSDAAQKGGKVLYLNDFDESGKTLADFVYDYYASVKT